MKKLLFFAFIFLGIISSQAQEVFKTENGKYVLKNMAGNIVTNQEYDQILYSKNCTCDKDIIVVRKGEKWGAIDTNGVEILALTYEHISRFEDGIATAKLNGKWGFIDKTGKVIIPFKYDMTLNFYQGIAAVSMDNKFGFINKEGELIIPYQYDDVSNFTYVGKGEKIEPSNAKYALVFIGKKRYFIDKSGNIVKAKKVEQNLPLKGWIGKESRPK